MQTNLWYLSNACILQITSLDAAKAKARELTWTRMKWQSVCIHKLDLNAICWHSQTEQKLNIYMIIGCRAIGACKHPCEKQLGGLHCLWVFMLRNGCCCHHVWYVSQIGSSLEKENSMPSCISLYFRGYIHLYTALQCPQFGSRVSPDEYVCTHRTIRHTGWKYISDHLKASIKFHYF